MIEVTVFEGRSHLLPAQRGREEIADYALSWAERHVVSLAEAHGKWRSASVAALLHPVGADEHTRPLMRMKRINRVSW